MISQLFVLSQRGDNIVFRDCESSHPHFANLIPQFFNFVLFLFLFFRFSSSFYESIEIQIQAVWFSLFDCFNDILTMHAICAQ
jgi:hypothetical protein